MAESSVQEGCGGEASRILAVMPTWVGDAVMATPAVRALRRRFRDARITALASAAGADVLEHNPHVNRILAADKRGVGPESGSRGELLRILRAERFDLAVVMPNSFRTAALAWRSGARRRVGYAGQWRSIFLTDAVRQPREGGRVVPINMVDRYLALCARAGCTDLSREEELFASAEDEARADAVLTALGIGRDDGFAVLAPGASYGPAKLWGAEKFGAVADALVERHGWKVLAHHGPGEEAVAQAVASSSRRGVLVAPAGAIDLKVLKAVVRRARLMVANDTGPRHYAVAYGVPNVAILGPTSRRYIDVNLERTRIVQAEVECGPCQRKACSRDHRCMEAVTVEAVMDAVESLVSGR